MTKLRYRGLLWWWKDLSVCQTILQIGIAPNLEIEFHWQGFEGMPLEEAAKRYATAVIAGYCIPNPWVPIVEGLPWEIQVIDDDQAREAAIASYKAAMASL